MKLLTIAIPTYNRCEACIKTINNFLSQIEKNNLKDDVHIFISDNHSTDSTYGELLKLQAKYPDLIQLNQNETNLGMGGNFLHCIKNCRTKYLWMPSDDDIYYDNALTDAISKLKENPSIIYMFLNCYVPKTKKNTVNIKDDFSGSLKDALKLEKIDSTHISPTIVKADLVKDTPIYDRAIEWALWQKIVRIKTNGEAFIFAKPRVSFDPVPNSDDIWILNPKKKALYFSNLLQFCLNEENNPLLAEIRENLLNLCAIKINECYGTKISTNKEFLENNIQSLKQEVAVFKKKVNKYKKRLIFLQLVVAFLFLLLIIETVFCMLNI